MPQILMTDPGLRGLETTTARVAYFDTKAEGLALRANQKTRTWYFVYRRDGSAPKWMRLGSYPADKLASMRDAALEQRRLLNKGLDPIAERDRALEAKREADKPKPAPPKAYTFADFVPIYVTFQKGRTKHWRDEEAKIERYLLPAWRTVPLRDITRERIIDLLDQLVVKGASGEPMTTGVNRVQAVISRMFTVALNLNKISSHPAARLIKRFGEDARDRWLSEDEIRALAAGLEQQPGAAADALWLRLLLGQRGEQIAAMTWTELNDERRCWEIPRGKMKKKRFHVVALPESAQTLLARRRALVPADEPRVFPGLTLTSTEHKALGHLHGPEDADGSYTWIDLRRTFTTYLSELGVSEETIGRILHHKPQTITGKVYNQYEYLPQKRQALDAWDVELQRIVAGIAKPDAKILPMLRRR